MILLTADLARAFVLGTSCSNQADALPLLRHALLEAEDGRLTVASTDMALTVKSQAKGREGGSWRACVPARVLLDIAKVMDGEDASVELVGNEVVIESGGTWKLATMDAKDYPSLPKYGEPWESEVVVDVRQFVRAVKRLAPCLLRRATAYDMPPYIIAEGSAEVGFLSLTATDGGVLSNTKVAATSQSASTPYYIDPAVAKAISPLFDMPLSIYQQKNFIAFGCGDTWLWQRKVEGEIPAWWKAVPSDRLLTDGAIIGGELVNGMIKKIVASGGDDPVHLIASEGKMSLGSPSGQVTSTASGGCEVIGGGIDGHFKFRYLDAVFSGIEGSVMIRSADHTKIICECGNELAMVMARKES